MISAGKAMTARALKPRAQLVNSMLGETPSQMIKQEAIEKDTRRQALVWTLSHTSTKAHRYHTQACTQYGGLRFIVNSLRGQASATPTSTLLLVPVIERNAPDLSARRENKCKHSLLTDGCNEFNEESGFAY